MNKGSKMQDDGLLEARITSRKGGPIKLELTEYGKRMLEAFGCRCVYTGGMLYISDEWNGEAIDFDREYTDATAYFQGLIKGYARFVGKYSVLLVPEVDVDKLIFELKELGVNGVITKFKDTDWDVFTTL